jgi:hypothetical protein
MSFTWSVSQSWDLAISGGSLAKVSGTDEVKQRILITLWHYWQEYFLNVPGGVPWYQLILGSKNQKIVESILRSVILGVPGVVSIFRLNIQRSSTSYRDFVLYADVEAVTGQVISIFSTVPSLVEPTGTLLTTETDAILTTEQDQDILI